MLGGGELPEDGRRELREYGAMRRELIAVERAALLGLRNDGRVSQDVVRRVERDLDLEEARAPRVSGYGFRAMTTRSRERGATGWRR